jgi:XTP/dITP diphosphohydrolase
MGKLAVASKNKGKLKEIAYLLSGLRIDVVSMEEAGFSGEIEETGSTFEENAIIKAKTVRDATGLATIADDSGLEVEYLKGAPGIYSSRFAGHDAHDEDNVKKLLEAMNGVPYCQRNARFVCVIAAIDRYGKCFTVRGECKGFIAEVPAGEGGFGYDPVFVVPEFGCTMAQLKPEDKNRISHRGIALMLMKEKLKKTPGFII